MKDYEDFFKGKKITLLGLGLLGRGVGDAEFLAPLAKELIITDKKTKEELASSLKRLRKFTNIRYTLGKHDLADFRDVDMVIKAAGVALDSPEIAAARQAGVPVYMSTALFAKFAMEAGATIVGVTGTRGKSTVAHMIHHAFVQAGKRAHLGGNIRGKSTLAMLGDVQEGDICVLELDSWQLQGFGEARISPNIAVFTNFMPDHLNYYRSDMNTYFADKANIFKFQRPGDVLIVGASVAERIRVANPPLDPIVPEQISRKWKLKIIGEHNRKNASLVATALQAAGLSDEEIQEGIESFEGVEGRLQFLREINGVKIYNDNNATTPEATIAALQTLQETRIILILGGTDKGLDMRDLISLINQRCKAVVLLAGSGTDSLLQAIPSSRAKLATGQASYKLQAPTRGPFNSLNQATSAALELAKEGDVVLFSPAFASFGMFKNEYDRNDQFLALIRKL